jgi:dTDP-4-dehydrorhamnose 3,5-epimerase
MSAGVEVRETSIAGVLLVVPRVFRDERGFFLETFNHSAYMEAGLPVSFVQDNHSRSRHAVLRGLHYQLTRPQGKLVRAARGRIFDVAVDIRVGSPTFGRWVGEFLDDEAMRMLWIPPGFAHGFCTVSDEADVVYKCTELYDPADERALPWDDPAFGIEWPIAEPLLSERDRRYPPVGSGRADLPRFA